MLIFASGRTDIPAFYSEWFMNRIREGFVDVRNPYYGDQVSRYRLVPDLVDCLVFCTKNPQPMIRHIPELRERGFALYFFVSITPYGSDIEPNVPAKQQLIESFISLSQAAGVQCVCWRYDPIFIDARYSPAYHERAFTAIADRLAGHTGRCIISFIDLYEKTKRNFPGIRAVTAAEQEELGRAFGTVGAEKGLHIESCAEKIDLSRFGILPGACISRGVVERAGGIKLRQNPGVQKLRSGCGCLPMHDIGAYNSCPHLCRYCYANYDAQLVRKNAARHDPNSSFLLGSASGKDSLHQAQQQSFRDRREEMQLELSF